jgi:hypothetical protein
MPRSAHAYRVLGGGDGGAGAARGGGFRGHSGRAVRGVPTALLLLGCCLLEPAWRPDFDIDIMITRAWTDQLQPAPEERQVFLSFTDRAAGCERVSTFRPEPGHCGGWSDAIGPPCGRWHCLQEVRVEHPGGVLARADLRQGVGRAGTSLRLSIPARTRDARLIIEGCGQRAELPFSTVLPAAPEVTRVTRVPDGFEVAWMGADDADMIEVEDGGHFGGTICAQREHTPVKLSVRSIDVFSGLSARSAIVEQPTPFGTAHIWRVAQARFEHGLFPADNDVPFRPTVLVEHESVTARFSVEVRLNPDREGSWRQLHPWPPEVETCRPTSDGLASGGDGPGCITGLRLEVNGRRASAIDHLTRSSLPSRLELPALPPGARVDLMIEGCAHESARLPLPTEPLAAPTITAFDQEGDDFTLAWDGAPGATSALAAVNSVIAGQTCHTDGRGPVKLHAREGEKARSTLQAVAAAPTAYTDFGPVHIWRVSPAATPP